jgi:hypothetical protein
MGSPPAPWKAWPRPAKIGELTDARPHADRRRDRAHSARDRAARGHEGSDRRALGWPALAGHARRLERGTARRPGSPAVTHPERDLVEILDETVVEIRALGFSPSGAALVIATTADVMLLTR